MNDFRSVYLPYCLKRLSNGSHIAVNRESKPLGVRAWDWVHYDEWADDHAIDGITHSVARKLSVDGSENLESIYLYRDGSVPTLSRDAWEDYSRRLEILAGLQFLNDI